MGGNSETCVIEPVFDSRVIYEILNKEVTELPTQVKAAVGKSLEALEKRLEATGCYFGVCAETAFRIREILVSQELDESGSIKFLEILNEAFQSQLPPSAQALILNDAVNHFPLLFFNNILLDSYLIGRISLAESFFTLDRDSSERPFIYPSQETFNLVFEKINYPENAPSHDFFTYSLAERILASVGFGQENFRREIEKGLSVLSAAWMETVESRYSGSKTKFRNLLLAASGRVFPIGQERYHSLGSNASGLLTPEEIETLIDLILSENPLLTKEGIGLTFDTGLTFKSDLQYFCDKLGFNAAHEAARFVEGKRIQTYVEAVKQFSLEMHHQRDIAHSNYFATVWNENPRRLLKCPPEGNKWD